MEIHKDSNVISEYKESKTRFQSLAKRKRNVSSSDSSDDEMNDLDDIIQKLCNKDENLDVGHDSTLFYKLIIHSDFIQIKDELVKPFYSELLTKSIQNKILDDIVENLERLEVVPHLKKFFVEQLFMIFQLSPVVRNDSLILDYSRDKVQYNVNLDTINSITMLPSAYKIMLSNEEFDISCLNFLIRICNVKKLILTGCNLNGRNVQALFHELKLESLNLSECGTCVNKIIQDNISGILDNLKELDISRNPLLNKTLESLRWIPLHYLNISNCIKSSGKFFNSIWFSDYFASQMDIEGEDGKGNMDILWEDGVLRETIEILNVSLNDLNKRSLQLILQSQLIELDISKCLRRYPVALSDVVFPKTLKILKAQTNSFNFKDFRALSQISLEKLEMDYDMQNEYFFRAEINFSDLYNTPLTKTLKELTIHLSSFAYQLISFISNFKLKYFFCECSTNTYDHVSNRIIYSYIYNPNLDKDCLQTLKLEGFCNGGIGKEIISEILKFNNLKQLYLYAWKSSEAISSILSCENLHESIESLGLLETYSISDDNIIHILKFKKLKKLSFTFQNDIRYNSLKKIVEMDTLKELEVSAVVRDIVNLDFARLICLAPINTLHIFRGGNISDEAFNYLMDESNSFGLSKNLVRLVAVGSRFEANLARVLKKVNWKEILLSSCHWKENSPDIFFSNENLTWSLNYLCIGHHNRKHWNQECFRKLLCTTLKTKKSLFQGDYLALKHIPISEFLFFLSPKKIRHKEDKQYLPELLKSNLSIVDTFVLDRKLQQYSQYNDLEYYRTYAVY